MDPDLARDVMATGRPAWQVLAGAARGLRAADEIRYRDDPFGVAYLVAALGFARRRRSRCGRWRTATST